MQKSTLNSFISKHTLGGNISTAIWECADSSIHVRVVSDDKSLLAEAELKEGLGKEFDGVKLGFHDVSRFVKILSVLDEEVQLSLNAVSNAAKSIKLTDKVSKVNFALSDLITLPVAPALKHVPSEFEVSIKLNDHFTNLFTKAKASLPDVMLFAVNATAKKVDIILGQTDVNTDTITIPTETNQTEAIEKLLFNANLVKEILAANKGIDANFEISKEGLGRIKYDTKEFKAIYYLVAKPANS